ncbi:MAG: VIT domain-containing protein [Rubripirellula sp.]|nr:VIT domain-containing protein [Rubripirellula sp.]
MPPIRPGQPGFLYDIAKLEVDASIRNQVAEVQVAQTFKNRSNRTLQVKFIFPLPYDGAIDQMTFMVDGEELEGRLLEADKAREIYQSYVRRSQDPALVQWIGTGMFQTQVFPVPAGAERTVSLRYTQICKRQGNLNDWLLPLSPAKFTSSPIGEINIRGRIRSETKFGNVYSPSHDVEIERDGDQVVRFEYKAKSTVPVRDFRVLWDTGDDAVQMSVVSHRPDADQDGYFMLMIQPQFPTVSDEQKKSGKNVILVLDKSGSMRGEKIDQARRAASYVVDKLRSRDRFTLINYDSRVETFRSELSSGDKETRVDASEYIDSMLAGGSTDIDGALARALQFTANADGPAYVVFMTDGQPTVGEKNVMKIAANVKRQLNEQTRLFSLGVGHDVNSRLLDKLASICLGQTMYVRPGEPLDDVVSQLYDRIGAPALTDAKLQLTVGGKEGRTRQIYPSEMYDLFSGDQLVIVGRYRKPGELKIKLTGKFMGKKQEYVFEDEFPKQTGSGRNVFVERLWATRRIGQIIDDIDLYGENQELIDELIMLSKKHGILTPYTAYLAEEQTDLNDLSRGREVTQGNLQQLQQESGELAFRQRDFKSQLKSAGRAAQSEDMDEMNFSIATPAGIAGGFGGGPPAVNAPTGNLNGQQQGGLKPSPLQQGNKRRAVMQIGSRTFFYKGDRYIDSEASDEQIAKAIEMEQFSDEYFDLIGKLGERSKAFLAESTKLLVLIDGKAYLIVPLKAEPDSPATP